MYICIQSYITTTYHNSKYEKILIDKTDIEETQNNDNWLNSHAHHCNKY